jgi:O-antigen ligase
MRRGQAAANSRSGFNAPRSAPQAPDTYAPSIAVKENLSIGVALTFLVWVLVLFDPHWYIAAKGPDSVVKIHILSLGMLLLTMMAGTFTDPQLQRRFDWYRPLVLYMIAGIISFPFSVDNGAVRDALQSIFMWWIMIAGTILFMNNVKRAETLAVMYGLQFLWWAAWGAKLGYVPWHTALSNYDGFGAFNVGGTGICFFLGAAASKKWFKWLMYATAGLCAMGVVASFARGAFLALMIMFAVVWLRSPHKGRVFAAGVGAGAVIVIAASLLFEEGFFISEIMSVFEEGTSEGTGEDRMHLWEAGLRVFAARPLFGSGPNNWGALASQIIPDGTINGIYSNSSRLYGMSMHNVYFTVLAEGGLIGIFAFGWMFYDFFKRNKELRSEEADRRWAAMGGKLKLHQIALGLEAAMIAFMADAFIYAMMSLHWFWTMLALNYVLHKVLTRGAPLAAASARRGAPPGLPAPVPNGIARRRH